MSSPQATTTLYSTGQDARSLLVAGLPVAERQLELAGISGAAASEG